MSTYTISGLSQNSIKYFSEEQREPKACAQKIKNSIKDFIVNFGKWSVKDLSEQLTYVSRNAQDTISAIQTRLPVDIQGQPIDRITQTEELLRLADDLDCVETIASKILENRSSESKTISFGAAKDWCQALHNQSNLMRSLAAELQSQMDTEARTLTSQLTQTTEALPKDVLGIIAQYLID